MQVSVCNGEACALDRRLSLINRRVNMHWFGTAHPPNSAASLKIFNFRSGDIPNQTSLRFFLWTGAVQLPSDYLISL